MTTGEYVTVQREGACVRKGGQTNMCEENSQNYDGSIQNIPPEVSKRWGDRAPFLMKITASDVNLSVLWLDLANS